MYSQAYILIHMYVIYVYRHLLGFHAVHFFYTGLFFAKQRGQKTQHNTHCTAQIDNRRRSKHENVATRLVFQSGTV